MYLTLTVGHFLQHIFCISLCSHEYSVIVNNIYCELIKIRSYAVETVVLVR